MIEVEGEEVRLTATEYKILELLMEHPGQVFSAEQIYENVWQETASVRGGEHGHGAYPPYPGEDRD